MTGLRIKTPGRLHFGPLAWGPSSPRQFGGVGLMIESPGIEITAEPAARWSAEGPLAARVLAVANRVAVCLAQDGRVESPSHFRVLAAPHEHIGLGVGTQLSLAVARLVCEQSGLSEPTAETLAELSGRGQRSGIGLHGFFRGGFLVDGGHRAPHRIPPLLVHLEFPPEWSVLVLTPRHARGLHGPEEARAFAGLPPISEATTERLCRLVLLGLLPAVVERDLPAFGASLTELQHRVGECFASAQGGHFASIEVDAIVNHLESLKLHGVGQSSWGPSLYAFSDKPGEERDRAVDEVRARFGLPRESALWTKGSAHGATLSTLNS